MSGLIRLAMALTAYLCVGTVLTAALGYGYLRRNGRLNDETQFRIVALVNGVDLQKIDESVKKKVEATTPKEETSYSEQQQQYQASSLQFDAKRKQLAISSDYFDAQLKRLTAATANYDLLGKEIKSLADKLVTESADKALLKVRAQLEVMDARKQVKPILVQMINDERLDEVIQLLGSMKKDTQTNVLRAFSDPEDKDMIYRIQQRIMAENPIKKLVTQRLQDLEKQDR